MATILRSKSSCGSKPKRLPIARLPAFWGCFAQTALFSVCLAGTVAAPLPGFAAPGTITSIFSFNRANGYGPRGALTAGPDGIFYGTTEIGGANDRGTVFSLDSKSNTITSLVSFDGTNGGEPASTLTAGSGGIFYGTTGNGGANELGSVFSFNSNSNSITSLASFDGNNGVNPLGALTAGSGGIFYGTTVGGGANSNGTVYSFDSNSNSITGLASFDGNNGLQDISIGGLTGGSGGIFYGTIREQSGFGSVYSFDSNTNSITKLVSLNGTNGANPFGALTAGPDGIFYGTTYNGGANGVGTVFSFDSNSNSITSFASFDSTTGWSPYAGLAAGSDGIFYGTTVGGGANDLGSVYSFDSNSNSITGLASFDSTEQVPLGGLTAGTDGIFYGTTYNGGTDGGYGSVFSFEVSAAPVPGPLPILGVVAALGYSRKLRKRIKSSKPEVISTTAV